MIVTKYALIGSPLQLDTEQPMKLKQVENVKNEPSTKSYLSLHRFCLRGVIKVFDLILFFFLFYFK